MTSSSKTDPLVDLENDSSLPQKKKALDPISLPEWRITRGFVSYPDALSEMKAYVELLQERPHETPDLIWALEHPPLYTLGTSAKKEHVLSTKIPSFDSGRGGEVTYHGPGQRVLYTMMALERYQKDIKWFVRSLEEWVILTLKEFGLDVVRRDGRVGLWVPENDWRDNKIAAVGVRVSKWVTYHGLSLNVSPDLHNYEGIVPCGIKDHGVTSLVELGINVSMKEVDDAFQKTFHRAFKRPQK